MLIPNSVEKIGKYAFSSDIADIGKAPKVTRLVLGNNIKTIDDSAFAYCENLTELIIPNGVETIGNAAFIDCNNLEGELFIPDTVTSIGNVAFSVNAGKNKLDSITISKSTTYNANTFGGRPTPIIR